MPVTARKHGGTCVRPGHETVHFICWTPDQLWSGQLRRDGFASRRQRESFSAVSSSDLHTQGFGSRYFATERDAKLGVPLAHSCADRISKIVNSVSNSANCLI